MLDFAPKQKSTQIFTWFFVYFRKKPQTLKNSTAARKINKAEIFLRHFHYTTLYRYVKCSSLSLIIYYSNKENGKHNHGSSKLPKIPISKLRVLSTTPIKSCNTHCKNACVLLECHSSTHFKFFICINLSLLLIFSSWISSNIVKLKM